MREKRRNKENQRPSKKTTVSITPLYTEELRLPTYPTQEMRSQARSIELKRTYNVPLSRKPGSRKSPLRPSRSGKHSTRPATTNPLRPATLNPIKFKQIMLQFKELKKKQQHSKSPCSCKSAKKKKYSFVTLKTQQGQSALTLKLQKTLKKLNDEDYLKEEELIPIVSSSDMYKSNSPELLTENEEDVNIAEMKRFCLKNTNTRRIIADFNGNLFEAMVVRIQRAWRRTRTRKLIDYYARFQPELSQNSAQAFFNQEGQENIQNTLIYLPQKQLYPQNLNRDKISQISNFEDEQQKVQSLSIEGTGAIEEEDYDQAVKKIKLEQLQKWNRVINLISTSKSDNPSELQRLLNTLAQQSQENKKNLEAKTSQLLAHSNRNEGRLEKRAFPLAQSDSEQSEEPKQEYDSKKYMEYLDGSLSEKSSRSSSSLRQYHHEKLPRKISKRKQELLLDSLRSSYYPIKLGTDTVVRSESLTLVKDKNYKNTLKKSTSQKMIKKHIPIFQLGLLQQLQSDFNLELLTKQFLQGTDPTQHNQDRLQLKLNELSQLRKSSQNEFQNNSSLHNQSQQQATLHRSSTQFNIQNKDQGSDSSSQTHSKQRLQLLTQRLLDLLVFEILKQIRSYSNTVLIKFRTYALSRRPVVRKRGFATNFSEIRSFLQSFIKMLLEEHSEVFANLQKPTGPTALQMLQYMTPRQSQESSQFEDDSTAVVVPNQAFQKYWRTKEYNSTANTLSQNTFSKQNFQYYRGYIRVFYRCLFDAFNQSLQHERNYGILGKPFPWKRSDKFHHKKSKLDVNVAVGKAQKRMEAAASHYCGLMIEREELTEFQGNAECLEQVMESKMSEMLARDLIDGEPHWVFYDDEEAEILVQISETLYVEIVIEFTLELYHLLNQAADKGENY